METPTETSPTVLSDAILEIQRTAVAAAEPTVHFLECNPGGGSTTPVKVPVLAVADGDGKVALHSLLDHLQAGTEFAQAQRLAAASGPDKRHGTATHQALESFIAHAKRFKDAASAIWADAAQRRLVSVLDYHPAGAESKARWGKHRGLYQCPLSEAWIAWGGGRALELDQDAFAALLDSRDRELTSGEFPTGKEAPNPAALITLASNLEVYSTATAKRERDPNTGRVKISFTEDKGISGTVMPPAAFLICIPVFQDAEVQDLEVRLRVAVNEGHATFIVQIHAAGDVLREAFSSICARVQRETEAPLFVGAPE